MDIVYLMQSRDPFFVAGLMRRAFVDIIREDQELPGQDVGMELPSNTSIVRFQVQRREISCLEHFSVTHFSTSSPSHT